MPKGNPGRQRKSGSVNGGDLSTLPPPQQLPAELKPYTLKSLVDYRLQGLTHKQIAQLYGVSRQAISHRFKGVWGLLDRDELEAYRENRVELMGAVEKEMLELLGNSDRQAKASLNNVAYAFTQLHQARRLEQGQSTSNLAIHEIVEQLHREKRKEPIPQDVVGDGKVTERGDVSP